MEFSILGPLEVRLEQEPLELGGARQRALLAILLTHANRVVGVERLAELLWGEEPPETAANILQVYVSQLRKVLEPDGQPFRMLRTRAPGYVLEVSAEELDAARFEHLLESARGLTPEKAAAVLRQALAMWRGPALADFASEPFALGEATRLNELHLRALEERIDADLALGRHGELVGELGALVEQYRLRERLCGQLMIALYRSGRQAEASDVYQRTRAFLVDEQGMEPGPALQAVLKRILQQDPDLGLPNEPKQAAPPSLPTGTVTFLITDVESSTRHWEEERVAMQAAMLRHDSIFNSAIERHQGQPVESGREGDSVLAAFVRATDAVACALEIQLALAEEPWPTNGALRVRMALHTGEAELRGGHYYGQAVYRCARLLAIGHGGQILISQSAEQVLGGLLPEDSSLRDLGSHRLKDLARPENVFQLLHSALPGDFPRLRSLEIPRDNLPTQLTSFIGREAEMADVSGLMRDARLVTLTGPGGSGKTRLAQQLASRLPNETSDGVWFIELAGLSEPDLLLNTVATTLGIRELPGQILMATVSEHLKQRQDLLVLDNCEHLIEAAAELADKLLAACPALRILATSRERLRVSGEHVYPVGPLGIPGAGNQIGLREITAFDAVRLFVDRASTASRSFVLNDHNALAVAQLCRRLDGIPLALELAAVQVAVMTPTDIVERLDARFQLLTSGTRTALPRQQTLLATIEWSHALLSEEEKVVFRRLATFAGGFDLESAESLCGGGLVAEKDVTGPLARLVEKSLVMSEVGVLGRSRYRLLETVREFGLEKLLEAGEREMIRRRHAEYFRLFAGDASRELREAGAEIRLARMEEEHDNLRAALGWTLDHDGELAMRLASSWSPFWIARGYLEEARDWLEAALTRGSPAGADDQSPPRAAALQDAARLAFMQGDLSGARRLYEEALVAHPDVDSPDRGALLNGLGNVSWDQGDPDSGRTFYERSLAVASSCGDIRGQGIAIANLATVAWYIDHNRQRARELIGQARDLLAGDRRYQAASQLDLGMLDAEEGRLEAAATQMRHGLIRLRDLDDRVQMVRALASFSDLAAFQASPARALCLGGSAEAHKERLGSTARWPHLKSRHELAWQSMRDVIGPDPARVAWEEGRHMSLEQAVEYALAVAVSADDADHSRTAVRESKRP